MEDYKERFEKEYHELEERIDKLEDLIVHAYMGKLDFELNCPVGLLELQLEQMKNYFNVLSIRRSIEIDGSKDRCLM